MFKKRTASFLIMLLMLSILLLTIFACTMPTASSDSSNKNKDNKVNEVLLNEDDQSRATVIKSKIDAFTIYDLDVNENFSYIAPYKSDEVIIFQTQTVNDEDTANIRCKLENNKYYVKMEEEKSKDSETSHDYETVKAITVKKGTINLGNGNTNAGEAGSKSIRRDSSHEWYTVNLSRTYTSDIVVFANVVTYNSAQECHVRIKDVTRSSFKIKLEEWAYRDGVHTNETVHYMVLKKGSFDLGKVNPDSRFDYSLNVMNLIPPSRGPIAFDSDFTGGNENSVLMSTLQTYNDPAPVILRTFPGVDPSGFDLCGYRKNEEESSNHGHGVEYLGLFMLGPITGPKSNAVDTCGKLKVSQRTGRLLSENGSVKVFKGMSLFWINWPEGKKFANASVVNWLVDDWKIRVLRIPVGGDPYNQYGGHIDNSGYKYNAAKLDAVIEEVIDACIYKGIYVILDWHEHDAIQTKSLAKEFFKKYAEKYKNIDNVLFETWNEPTCPKNDFMLEGPDAIRVDDDSFNKDAKFYFWAKDIKPYHEEIIDIIRGTGNTNIIICGTGYFSTYVDVYGDDRIDDDNVMYSSHFYARSHKFGDNNSSSPYKNLVNAIEDSTPVFVTEWGTTNCDGGQPDIPPYYSSEAGDGETGMEVDEAQSKAWMSLLKDNYISWCNWSVTDKREGSAILKYNADVSDIGGWLSSDLTESGELIRSMIRSTSY